GGEPERPGKNRKGPAGNPASGEILGLLPPPGAPWTGSLFRQETGVRALLLRRFLQDHGGLTPHLPRPVRPHYPKCRRFFDLLNIPGPELRPGDTLFSGEQGPPGAFISASTRRSAAGAPPCGRTPPLV